MKTAYDRHYRTGNLFGEPYPELLAFFSSLEHRGRVLDLGCGQGRDAIALARLGFPVTGVDHSEVGIGQMNAVAVAEGLDLKGQVADIHTWDAFGTYDVVLLDSMFHFAARDKEKEVGLVRKILSGMKAGGLLVVCIQDTGSKVRTLYQAIDADQPRQRLVDERFQYTFKDPETGLQVATDYRLVVVRK
ncbi:MAG: methyltransferase domain-containing protein [Flavobacteriales bacterium]|nr:methyltransferase domain-containing protein [Flavobacteriales bacterium]MCB0809295.1 methyltransferase domain-containing protein [Flavobacteriales bacterium]